MVGNDGEAVRAGLRYRAPLPKVLSIALLLAVLPGAMAKEGFNPRNDRVAPRDVFFSDYFLFSAQADVVSMIDRERVALGMLLDICDAVLTADEPRRLRCEMARQQYLMDYRQSRHVDRLLDAVQFMTSLIRYNKTIGRQNEVGLDGRLGSIQQGFRDAVRLMTPITGTEASVD